MPSFLSLSLPVTLIIAFLIVLVIALALWILRIERKMRILLATKNADRIDDTLDAMQKTLERLETSREDTDERMADMERRLRGTVRGIETVRFNPFEGDGSGGNNSFATALITEDGDGIVISSLYTRSRTNVFAKQLENHASSQDLSDEEQEAVQRASQQCR